MCAVFLFALGHSSIDGTPAGFGFFFCIVSCVHVRVGGREAGFCNYAEMRFGREHLLRDSAALAVSSRLIYDAPLLPRVRARISGVYSAAGAPALGNCG